MKVLVVYEDAMEAADAANLAAVLNIIAGQLIHAKVGNDDRSVTMSWEGRALRKVKAVALHTRDVWVPDVSVLQ